MSNKVYIHAGKEVVLTGRVAKREGSSSPRRRSPRRIDLMHEIKPADPECGSWTRWVKLEELYEVMERPEVTEDTASNELPDVPVPQVPLGESTPPFIPMPPWEEPEVCGSPKPFPIGNDSDE